MLRSRFFTVVAAILFMSLAAFAQQDDDVLIVDVEGRLTSGRPNFDGTWRLGIRSYQGRFDSDVTTRDPGWNTLGSGSPAMPAGAAAPPPDTDLEWDFLPMKISGLAANLFFWNGAGAVSFGPTPGDDYELFLQSKSSGFIAADGSAALVSGAVIDDTDSIGALHRHRFWFLDDGDGNMSADPADGIYLVALRTRMEGLDRSRPLFFAFRTLSASGAALDQVQTWVDAVLNELAPDFAADFDGDLDVDQNDLQNWMLGYGASGAAALQTSGDATFDQTIDGVDLLQWQRQFGSQMASFPGVAPPALSGIEQVPEPGSLVLMAGSCLALLSMRSKRGLSCLNLQ